jgi:hypothetical protein
VIKITPKPVCAAVLLLKKAVVMEKQPSEVTGLPHGTSKILVIEPAV